jgi:hypothetical protein
MEDSLLCKLRNYSYDSRTWKLNTENNKQRHYARRCQVRKFWDLDGLDYEECRLLGGDAAWLVVSNC